jgi:hypothetical protein
MRKIRSVVAVLAVVGGLLATPITAASASVSTASAATTYTLSNFGLCDTVGCDYAWVSLNVYSTYSYSQVWINGTVDCEHGGQWVTSWCGKTNNGESYLNVGENWVGPDISGYEWYRLNIYANGAGCRFWGTTYNVTFINRQCEEAA